MAYQTQQLPASPQLLTQLEPHHAALQQPEVAALHQLHNAGMAVTEILIVPADAEERFYRLNNLAAQLLQLFAGVDPADPDEDDIEERAPEAQKLIRSHYLLDEFIDLFYDRLQLLSSQVEVRRPVFASNQSGIHATRGRPALLAVKNLWADAWSFENLMQRLQQDASFAPPAQPLLITGAGRQPASAELNAQGSQILAYDVTLTVLKGAVSSVSQG